MIKKKTIENFQKKNKQINESFQNPLYMKEKFRLVIETLHLPDCGNEENVSLIHIFSFLFLVVFVVGLVSDFA